MRLQFRTVEFTHAFSDFQVMRRADIVLQRAHNSLKVHLHDRFCPHKNVVIFATAFSLNLLSLTIFKTETFFQPIIKELLHERKKTTFSSDQKRQFKKARLNDPLFVCISLSTGTKIVALLLMTQMNRQNWIVKRLLKRWCVNRKC